MLKTYIIDLDALTPEICREIMGFILVTGLAFRKIDLVTGDRVGKSLVVELTTKIDEKALNRVLRELSVANPIIIGKDDKATLDGKKLGLFCQIRDVTSLTSYYIDKTSGKKFTLIQGDV